VGNRTERWRRGSADRAIPRSISSSHRVQDRRTLHLRSRNNKDFSTSYPAVIEGLARLPDETVIDGEIVAFDEGGRPSFNALQNFGSSPASVVFYVFDVMTLAGRDVMCEPLDTRRRLLEQNVLPKLQEPVRYTPPLDVRLSVLIQSVKA